MRAVDADTPFMTGSAANTPATPEFFRVSDVDRDRAVDELRKEFVDGRLSQDTFMLRMHAAMDARNRAQLSGLFSDLPPRVSWLTRSRQTVRRLGRGAREVVQDCLPMSRREQVQWDYQEWGQAPVLPGQAPVLPSAAPGASGAGPDRTPLPLMFPPGADTSFTIGRDQRCDLYISDMTVSRLHARLSRGSCGWLLTDLGSSNGTRVNGWRLRAAVPVQPGDTITFGSAVFILQPDPDPDPGPGQEARQKIQPGAPRDEESPG
jgi:FHA domain-containing protein/uncharacterized protein DUF1707